MIDAGVVEELGRAAVTSACVAAVSCWAARRQGWPEDVAVYAHLPWAYWSLAVAVSCAAARHQPVLVALGLALVGVWCRMWAAAR